MLGPNRPSRIAAVAIAALLLAACGGGVPTPITEAPADPQPAPEEAAIAPWTQEGGPLVVGRAVVVASDVIAPLALQEGWFEQAGLDVEAVEERSPIDLFPLLVSGDIDVMAMAVSSAALSGFVEGVPMRIPATTVVLDADSCSTVALLGDPTVLDAIVPTDPTTTRGLRIGGTFRSLTSARYLDALTRQWGITPDDLVLTEVPLDSHIAAVRTGEVDAVFSLDPVLTLGAETGDAVVAYPMSEVLEGETTGFLLFGSRLLEDRELGARFLAVHLHAVERLNEGATPENIEFLASVTGLEPDILERMCLPDQDPDGRAHETNLTEIWEFAVARGDVERVVPADEVWDHTFLDRARELLAEGDVVLTD